MSRSEVMVVGAGPAGLSTALALADKGCRVTVVSPETKTGYRSVYSLPPEGAARPIFSGSNVRPLTDLRLLTQRGTDISVVSPECGMAVNHQAIVEGLEGMVAIALNPIKIERLPVGVINKIVVFNNQNNVQLCIDGERMRTDYVVDATGVEAFIARQVDVMRFGENFLAEHVFGGIFTGQLDKKELILVFGPGGGTSWVAPSLAGEGLVDVVFSAWGAYKDNPLFLETALARLKILFDFVKRKPGIHLGIFNPEHLFHGMIRSQPSSSPRVGRVFCVGEAAGMAKPFSGESLRRAIDIGRILAGFIDRGESSSDFYTCWRKLWSGYDLFFAACLARARFQKEGNLGGTADCVQNLISSGRFGPDQVRLFERWITEGSFDLRVLAEIIKDPEIRRIFTRVLLYNLKILLAGVSERDLELNLPKITKN